MPNPHPINPYVVDFNGDFCVVVFSTTGRRAKAQAWDADPTGHEGCDFTDLRVKRLPAEPFEIPVEPRVHVCFDCGDGCEEVRLVFATGRCSCGARIALG